MPETSPSPVALWTPPTGVRVRGTLAVIAGRAESARVYERFGRRIAVDGYVVGVFELSHAASARGWLAAQETAPRVLVGSDAGATAVLDELVHRAPVDGAIVAGTPVDADAAEPEASARTACPVHLGVLADPSARVEDTVDGAPLPDRDALAFVAVPVLAVHGGADAVAAFPAASAYLGAIPEVTIVETVGGLHDALNDQSHRSVAAQVILWLERLRAGDAAAPLVRELVVREQAGVRA